MIARFRVNLLEERVCYSSGPEGCSAAPARSRIVSRPAGPRSSSAEAIATAPPPVPPPPEAPPPVPPPPPPPAPHAAVGVARARGSRAACWRGTLKSACPAARCTRRVESYLVGARARVGVSVRVRIGVVLVRVVPHLQFRQGQPAAAATAAAAAAPVASVAAAAPVTATALTTALTAALTAALAAATPTATAGLRGGGREIGGDHATSRELWGRDAPRAARTQRVGQVRRVLAHLT